MLKKKRSQTPELDSDDENEIITVPNQLINHLSNCLIQKHIWDFDLLIQESRF